MTLGKNPLGYLGEPNATTEVVGITRLATIAETTAGTRQDIATTPAGVAAIAIAGAPNATTSQRGIIEIATNSEAVAGIATDKALVPSNLASVFASPPTMGGTTPGSATFSGLTVDSTGAISLEADAESQFSVAGGGVDLILESTGGRVIINGEEAANNAITLVSAAGGLDVDTALLLSLSSSRNNAQAILIEASAGGIDINATGAPAEDIDITNTNGSVRITAGESTNDAIVLSSSTGGIDITAGGGDLDITATGGGILIQTDESATDSIVIESTAGGIRILASGAAATEDISLIATGSSVNLESTEDAALAIYLHADGGTSETIRIRSDQGTGAASLDLLSDVGGITLTGGLASADAINLVCSNAAGGVDINAGTAGVLVDATGGQISLDAQDASNFTVTGAFDLTVSSTLGSVVIEGGEAAVDAVKISSTDVAGGVDINAGTGGLTLDSTGLISIDGAAASNFSVSGAGIDLTIGSAAGRVIINGGEAAANAVTIESAAGGLDVDVALQMNLTSSQAAATAVRVNASDAAGGIDVDAGTGGIAVDTTGGLSLDSQAASNFTVTGAFDLLLRSTLGSVNITAGEDAADGIVLTSSAGGIDLLATGEAGQDIDIVNTGGSVNITASEDVSNAIVVNASGAASGLSISAGTSGITLNSGLVTKVTTVATAASPYAVLGTDYFITTNSTGGIMTITLPAAPATGRTLIIYDGVGQAGGNAVTIDGNGKNIAAGGSSAATKAINTAYESYTLTYNGTLWCGQNTV